MSYLKAAALALGVLTVAGGVSTGAADAAGTLRIGTQEDPDRLDPALGGTLGGRFIFTALCDKLVDLAPNLDLVPQLATSWSWSPDGRTLTMNLRHGVTFQDGEPMDANAVKANLERYRAAPDSVRKTELKPVSAIDVVDPSTVRIVLSQPYAPLIAVLSDRAGMMASPKAFERMGKDFFTHPVCSGPFSFNERVAQDHITLDRFPGYWNANAIHFDQVIFRPTPDATLRLVNLRAGQLDILQDLAPSDAGSVRNDPKLALTSITGLGYAAVGFNVGNGPKAGGPFGRDPRMREAFEAAIDRNVINQVVMGGLFVPDNQTELPQSPYFNKAIPVPPRDVARAKALLAAAGVEHPTLEMIVANTPRDMQVAEVMQSMAADAGITVKIIAGEANANIAAMNGGNFESAIDNWSGRADPDPNISIYLACDSFQDWGKYCSPKFNNLLAEARAQTDPTQRQAVYRQVVETYTTDRPALFLYHNTWLFASTAKLKGFVPVPDGLIRIQSMSGE
jgi:peptide/nickel transport system substrate-binding protein